MGVLSPWKNVVNQPSARVLSDLLVILCFVSFGGCNLLSSGDGDDAKASNADQTSNVDQADSQQPKNPDAKKVPTTPPAGVVASVNGSLIAQERFDQLFEERARVYRLQKRPIPPRLVKTYKTSALQKLIDQTLLQQHFDAHGVTLTQDEKTKVYLKYKERFRGEKSYLRFLKRSDKSEEDVKDQVFFDALVDKALLTSKSDELSVSDEEVSQYYNQYREKKYTKEAQVRVSHILVPAAANSGKKLLRQQKRVARKLYKEVKKTDAKSFAKVAQEKSADASTKMRGGDLGFFERRGTLMFDLKFEKALSKLKVGEISDPVLTSKGYHLIRLTDRQPPQVRVSHILLDNELTKKEIKARIARAYKGDFYELAKELSKDEATRIRGGDLGFIHKKNPHRFGEAFKEACLKGKSGEILGPIESSSGKHIVYITQRRPERFRASHILIKLPKRPKRSEKKVALEKIKKIKEELKANSRTSNSLFVRLAKKYSEDSTKDRGGDLGAFYLGGEPKISAKFEEAVFKAPIGKVTGPLASSFGWHLVFVHDRKDRRERQFDEVKDEIHGQLKDKRLRRAKSNLIKQLRGKGEIKRHIEL